MTPIDVAPNAAHDPGRGPDVPARDFRPGTMPAQVAAFLNALRRVPIAAWDRCASGCPGAVPGGDGGWAPAHGAARAAWERARENLNAAIGTMPGVAARIRQRIDDHVAACEGIASAASTARMRVAAHLAAAALAARPLLSERDFDQLYAPFAQLIPETPAG